MKGIIGLIAILVGIFCGAYAMVWHGWVYPKDYEYSLKLADDASLPKVKADYLEQYLSDVSSITGPPRYFFMRKDLELKTQRDILRGLVQRFRDIANISPNDMAYQQGMMQLTGQEMDHQLDRISGIFKDAKLRENPINYFLMTWCIFLGPSIGLALLCLYSVE